MSRQKLYLVRVQHADGRRLTWMHMGAQPGDAIAWASSRWPDCGEISCERLRPRPRLAVLDGQARGQRAGTGACPYGFPLAPFVGARHIAGGVPVFSIPLTAAP